MCECCSQHAAGHRSHIHVSVGTGEGFRGLERVISDIPGIISMEFAGETGKAKVVFDKRITETAMLKRILGENGYTAA